MDEPKYQKLSLDNPTYQELTELANREGLSRSAYVRRLIRIQKRRIDKDNDHNDSEL